MKFVSATAATLVVLSVNGVEGALLNDMIQSRLSNQVQLTGDAACAALTSYGECRKHYYEYQNTANGVFDCNWDTNEVCVYTGDRDVPGGNPLDPDDFPPANSDLQACLASQHPWDGSGCRQYTGTKTSGKNANDFATCYRIQWRKVESCKEICLQLFSLNVEEYTWGYKVYDACTIGCGYQWRYTDWREELALDAGLWSGDTTLQNEIRIVTADKPKVDALPEYQAEIDNYDCEIQCQKTVWTKANNKRCDWKYGYDINVFEINDFGAVTACRIGCLMGNDPSMGALPPGRREAKNDKTISTLYPQ